MSQFEFNAWAQENELESETVDLLHTHGFKSYKNLLRLSDELLKKLFIKNVSSGKNVFLDAGLDRLRVSEPPTGCNRTSVSISATTSTY